MQLNSYLVKSRHGIYYLRLQRKGVDKRVSLRTRDPSKAIWFAYKFGATMSNGFDFANLRGWQVEKNDQDFILKTDGTERDNADGLKALALLLQASISTHTPSVSNQPSIQGSGIKKTISLKRAIGEYRSFLEDKKNAPKSQRMALSTLDDLVKILGSNYDLSLITDRVIKDKWISHRLNIDKVKGTTIKRDLSFIRQFIEWAIDSERNYCPSPLTLTFKADNNTHYDYFDSSDLKLIFDSLPNYAIKPWQFWIPVIGLYTGARISEPAGMEVKHIFKKSNMDVMHLPGTKTDASPRDIPIHPDLVKMGLVEFANQRKQDGHQMLFDVTFSEQNGFGAAPSKWFTDFKRNIGIIHKDKVFHSFRHTITDHLNQHGSDEKANHQYTGHKLSGGVKTINYGRKPLNLKVMKLETIDKIDWQNYCEWQPDLATLKETADKFLPSASIQKSGDNSLFDTDDLLYGQI